MIPPYLGTSTTIKKRTPDCPLSLSVARRKEVEEEKKRRGHQLISTLEGSVLPLQNEKKVPEKERFTNSLQALLK